MKGLHNRVMPNKDNPWINKKRQVIFHHYLVDLNSFMSQKHKIMKNPMKVTLNKII